MVIGHRVVNDAPGSRKGSQGCFSVIMHLREKANFICRKPECVSTQGCQPSMTKGNRNKIRS